MSSPIDIEPTSSTSRTTCGSTSTVLVAEGYSVAGGQRADPFLIDPGGKRLRPGGRTTRTTSRLNGTSTGAEVPPADRICLKLQYWAEDHGERPCHRV